MAFPRNSSALKASPASLIDSMMLSGAGFDLETHYADERASFAIVDGHGVTGQNPASSTAAAKLLLDVLAHQAPA